MYELVCRDSFQSIRDIWSVVKAEKLVIDLIAVEIDLDVVDDGDYCVEDGDSQDEDQSETDEMVARDSLRCGDWPLEVFQTIWTYKCFRKTI